MNPRNLGSELFSVDYRREFTLLVTIHPGSVVPEIQTRGAQGGPGAVYHVPLSMLDAVVRDLWTNWLTLEVRIGGRAS